MPDIICNTKEELIDALRRKAENKGDAIFCSDEVFDLLKYQRIQIKDTDSEEVSEFRKEFREFGWDYKIVPNDQDLGVRLNWKSIDTAPKDGEEILLWNSSFPDEILIGKWDDGFYSDDYRVDATHWMRIPKPPMTEWQEKGMCCETFWDVVRIGEGNTYLIEDIPYKIIFCPWCGERVCSESA